MKFGNETYARMSVGETATKFGAESAGKLMAVVVPIVVPLKFSLVIESQAAPATEWFTTKTWLVLCWTA